MARLGAQLEPPDDSDVSALVPGENPESDAGEGDESHSLDELLEEITETPDGVEVD